MMGRRVMRTSLTPAHLILCMNIDKLGAVFYVTQMKNTEAWDLGEG